MLRPVVLGSILVTLGVSAAGLILAMAEFNAKTHLFSWEYAARIWLFTLTQAGLSTLASLILGLLIASGIAWRQAPWKPWVMASLNLSFVLPPLVVVLILIKTVGHNGIINIPFSPYGLPGILLAHCLLNAPFIARLLIQKLEQIPTPERLLTQQLGLNPFLTVRWLWFAHIWPALSQTLLFVFALCVNSFAIVLSLGGGPSSTTLEVAIYQSLKYDFNPVEAGIFSLMQCLTTLGCGYFLLKHPGQIHTSIETSPIKKPSNLATFMSLSLLGSVWGIPILGFIVNQIQWLDYSIWLFPVTYSVGYGLLVSLSGLLLVIALLLTKSTEPFKKTGLLKKRGQPQKPKTQNTSIIKSPRTLTGLLTHIGLIIPTITLTTGLTFIWYRTALGSVSPIGLILWVQTLMTLPFYLRALEEPWRRAQTHYNALCNHIGLGWLQRTWCVYRPILKPIAKKTFVLTLVIVMGDIATPALLGFEHFPSLAVSVSQALSQYQFDTAYTLASIHLILTLLLFFLAEKRFPLCSSGR